MKEKRNRAIIMLIAVASITAVIVLMGAHPKIIMDEDMERTIEESALLIMGQDCILDEEGNLDEECLQNYQRRLEDTFSKGSQERTENYEIMKQAIENYGQTADVVTDNAILDFYVKELTMEDDVAIATVDIATIQKYIPYIDGNYRFLLAVGQKTIKVELEKETDKWKVSKYTILNFEFGSPKEMRLSDKNYERNFSVRNEALEYAETIDLKEEFGVKLDQKELK